MPRTPALRQGGEEALEAGGGSPAPARPGCDEHPASVQRTTLIAPRHRGARTRCDEQLAPTDRTTLIATRHRGRRTRRDEQLAPRDGRTLIAIHDRNRPGPDARRGHPPRQELFQPPRRSERAGG